MGYEDKKDEIVNVYNTHDRYMSDFMNHINSLHGKTASYQYAFLKAILDNIFNVNDNLELDFNYLSYSFSKAYWNLVSKYELPQFNNSVDKKSKIEMIIESMIEENQLLKGVDFDSLKEEDRNKYLKKTKNIISKDVVGALCRALNYSFYGFDKNAKKIWFNRQSYEFLMRFKMPLEKLNYYAWVLWIERRLDLQENEKGNLESKLDIAPKRESLKRFCDSLRNQGDTLECFYCKEPLTLRKTHMDHFIPWSFVKNDKIWNLVFSCHKCNESKNNKMANSDYLNKLISRNERVLNDGHENELRKLYESAKYNGFVDWNRTFTD